MNRFILIVDDALSRTSQLKAKLANSLYQVATLDSLAAARQMIAQRALLLVLVSDRVAPLAEVLLFCSEISGRPDAPPVMLFGSGALRADAADERRMLIMRALASGAQDYLQLPVDDVALMARVRSLVRQGAGRWQLSPSVRDVAASGPLPGGVALVSPSLHEAVAWRHLLTGHLPVPVRAMHSADLMLAVRRNDLPCAVVLAAPEGQSADLRLLAELKASPVTAHIPVIIVGGAAGEMGILALDLGAQDVLPLTLDPAELALRLRQRLAQSRRLALHQRETSQQLHLAKIDPLTGVHNRRSSLQKLGQMQEDFYNGADGYAVLLVDIDRFKRVNDTWGHPAGDAVLTTVAQRLGSCLREVDHLGRIGGEEFLVILPQVGLSEACDLAETLRQKVAGCACQVSAVEAAEVTISIGLCQPEPDDSVTSILARADRALYSAKSLGRNLVEVHA